MRCHRCPTGVALSGFGLSVGVLASACTAEPARENGGGFQAGPSAAELHVAADSALPPEPAGRVRRGVPFREVDGATLYADTGGDCANEGRAACRRSAIATWLDADDAPLLVAHDQGDPAVPFAQSAALFHDARCGGCAPGALPHAGAWIRSASA